MENQQLNLMALMASNSQDLRINPLCNYGLMDPYNYHMMSIGYNPMLAYWQLRQQTQFNCLPTWQPDCNYRLPAPISSPLDTKTVGTKQECLSNSSSTEETIEPHLLERNSNTLLQEQTEASNSKQVKQAEEHKKPVRSGNAKQAYPARVLRSNLVIVNSAAPTPIQQKKSTNMGLPKMSDPADNSKSTKRTKPIKKEPKVGPRISNMQKMRKQNSQKLDRLLSLVPKQYANNLLEFVAIAVDAARD